MSTGDVPRCPQCGLYMYPLDSGSVHLCGPGVMVTQFGRYIRMDEYDAQAARIALLEGLLREAKPCVPFRYSGRWKELRDRIDAFLNQGAGNG